VQRLGKEYVFVASDVPSLAAARYRVTSSARGQPDAADTVNVREETHTWRIETACAVVHLNKESGAIGSYYDRRLDREFVGYGVDKHLQHVHSTRADLALNVFQVLDESPNAMSAWLINDIVREESLLRGAGVRLMETGPVFARFRVSHRFRSSRIHEDILFFNHLPRVEFEAVVDWRERGDGDRGVPQLKVSFGSSLTAARARFEGPFTVTERPGDGQEQPTQKWADVTGDGAGFTLLNDSRYGCDVLGGRLRLTLLRNPYSPDPETDNGRHVVRFAFVPHGTDWSPADAVRWGMQFNRPALCSRTGGRLRTESNWLRIQKAPSVVCTCLRQAEHSDRLVLRFFETSGTGVSARVCAGKGIRDAQAVNFLEHPAGRPLKPARGWIVLRFRPYEVKTVAVRLRR
jgi:alpha-mannosidase